MRTVLITLFSLLSVFGISQVKVDYAEIERNIKDVDTKFHYPALLKRYMNGDSTLTLEEKRHCYYGYSFHTSYDPFKGKKSIDFVDTLIAKSNDEMNLTEVNEIIDSAFIEHPFDLKVLLYLIKFNKIDSEKRRTAVNQLTIILDAILSSGDGKTKNTAFDVVLLSHESLVINKLGLERSGKQSLGSNSIESLSLSKNKQKIKKLYFELRPFHLEENPKNMLFHQFHHAFLLRYPLDFSEIEKEL